MAEHLHSETQARLTELCEKIVVAYRLDPEIQAELRGHMEDKLLAYLSGQETLSEADAFILVREHFGDPARVKSLLQDVHAVETSVSLVRRLTAIVALMIAQTIGVGLVTTASWSAAAWLHYVGWDLWPSEFYPISVVTTIVVSTLIVWRVLCRWQRSVEQGKRPWFQTCTPFHFVLVFIGVAAAILMVPEKGEISARPFISPVPSSNLINGVVAGVFLACMVYQAVMWLWWCDRPPRRARTLAIAALIWIAVGVVPWAELHLFEVIAYSFDPATFNPDSAAEWVLYRAADGQYPSIWAVRLRETPFVPSSVSVASPIPLILIVAAASFAYRRLESTGRMRALIR